MPTPFYLVGSERWTASARMTNAWSAIRTTDHAGGVRQEQELRRRPEGGQDDARDAAPGPAAEDAAADGDGDEAQDEQDPAPPGEADSADAVVETGADVVLGDRRDALEDGEHSVDQLEDARQGDAPAAQARLRGGPEDVVCR
ncbi:hypothetical protein [Streptomyces tendae]|uniref:hypothetical protein n=1 Tax=Streptomyces tendae TaxID=1932 RepID=UPI001330A9FB|nr:hypothetical protein [Streptomyces tendae]